MPSYVNLNTPKGIGVVAERQALAEERRTAREAARAARLERGWAMAREGKSLGDWALAEKVSKPALIRAYWEKNPDLRAAFNDNARLGPELSKGEVIWRLKLLAGVTGERWSQKYAAETLGMTGAGLCQWKRRNMEGDDPIDALESYLTDQQLDVFMTDLHNCPKLSALRPGPRPKPETPKPPKPPAIKKPTRKITQETMSKRALARLMSEST